MFDTSDELDLGDIKMLTRADGEKFEGGFLEITESRSKRIRENVPITTFYLPDSPANLSH